MQTKPLWLILLLCMIPTMQALAVADEATFSLVTYDPWQKPSKPLPKDWAYLLKLSANLQTNGYYGASFYFCSTDKKDCWVVTAHRGTTAVWNTYNDFTVAMGKEPYTYYSNALKYDNSVQQYAKKKFGSTTNIHFEQTGHSIGAILAELLVATRGNEEGYVFDSPGSQPIVQTLINQKKLPADALTTIGNNVHYDFSGINALNTFNAQAATTHVYTNYEFLPEDFKNIPLSTIGSPGKTYYFRYYSLNQHSVLNFYNKWNHSSTTSAEINDAFTWPVGLDAGYKYYISTDSDSRQQYWSDYMLYMWKHNPALHTKYKDDLNAFCKDFVSHLKDGSATPGHFSLDTTILNHQQPVTPITSEVRPTLYDVINNDYDGHAAERRQIYAAASNDEKLYYAVMCGDVNFAEKLIQEAHANINTQHGEGHYSLLQIAIMLGYLDMTQLLLKYHANPELIDDHGNTALDTVAQERYEDAGDYTKALIAGGAALLNNYLMQNPRNPL